MACIFRTFRYLVDLPHAKTQVQAIKKAIPFIYQTFSPLQDSTGNGGKFERLITTQSARTELFRPLWTHQRSTIIIIEFVSSTLSLCYFWCLSKYSKRWDCANRLKITGTGALRPDCGKVRFLFRVGTVQYKCFVGILHSRWNEPEGCAGR